MGGPENLDSTVHVTAMSVAFFQRLTIPSSCPERFAKLMKKCWLTDPKVGIYTLLLKKQR